MLVMITILVLESGNSQRVTWLWPRGRKFQSCIGRKLWLPEIVSTMDMEASLWHQRLSHINEKGLNCLAKKDMLPGLKNANLEKCFHCMVGK